MRNPELWAICDEMEVAITTKDRPLIAHLFQLYLNHFRRITGCDRKALARRLGISSKTYLRWCEISYVGRRQSFSQIGTRLEMLRDIAQDLPNCFSPVTGKAVPTLVEFIKTLESAFNQQMPHDCHREIKALRRKLYQLPSTEA